MYLVLSLCILIITNVIAKEVISINAHKMEEIPAGIIEAHNPDTVIYNKSFIENSHTATNIFNVVEGSHSVEYQKNLQDFGGHTGISINHLPFYYTSTFIDGILIPETFLDTAQLFSSSSVQNIKVNKGAGSSNIKPASLAGSVEIETLNALQESISAHASTGNFGFYNAGINATNKINEKSGIMFSINANGQNHIDKNKDNIAESPKLNNIFTTLAHQFNEGNLKIKTRLDISSNKRKGGSTIVDTKNSEGNPFNFLNAGSSVSNGFINDEGDTITYNEGTAGMLEIIDNTRFALLSSVESQKYTGGGVVSLLQRDNFYSGNKYKANESNVFLTGARKININNIKLKLGGDFQYQKLSSDIINNLHTLKNPDGYSFAATSLFGDILYSRNNIDANISGRGTHHSQFNFIGTLKSKVNYHHTQNIISTITAGNGYYLPGSSFEQNHEFVTENIASLKRNVTKATQALNASYNTNFVFNKSQINLNYNYNEIKNIASLDIHDGDAQFKTLNGKYKTQGVGLDFTYFITPTLLWNVTGEKYWHDLSSLEEGYVILARPDYKLFTKLTKKINSNLFNIKATYFGKQDLEKFYGKLYNLSGTQNARFSKDYIILDADYTKTFHNKYKIYFGVENILNFVQVRNSPQIVAHHEHLDNINSWGPVRGRFFYIGTKIDITK